MIDGQIIIGPKNVTPSGARTGDSIRKCYLHQTNNCGGGISREHVLSRAVLKHITNTGKISFRDRQGVRTLSIDSNALQTKALCRRHNTALSPIDTEAGRLIKAIQTADVFLADPSQNVQRFYIFHGFDIERWLLKAMLNIYRAKLSRGPIINAIPPPSSINAFQSVLRSPLGLYVKATGPQNERLALRIAKEASFYLLYDGSIIVGCAVILAGIELKLVLSEALAGSEVVGSTHIHRPGFINFFAGRKIVSIVFAHDQPGRKALWISRSDPNADPPAGIFDVGSSG